MNGDHSTFQELRRLARTRLLKMHYESKVGHVGGNLSCLDALLFLHHYTLEQSDTFVLSKGHAVGALYVTLWSIGKLSDKDLLTFHADSTLLAGHPVANWMSQIAFATGSLGHGFSLAAGVAMGKRMREEKGRVFCLCSDGEWQEGSTWEALIFTHHQKLDNLTVLVDVNGLQGFGSTKEVASMDRLRERIAAFGLETMEIDGHDPEALATISQHLPSGPRIVLLRTVKGKGISFMENRMEWHYLPLSAEQYAQALRELETP